MNLYGRVNSWHRESAQRQSCVLTTHARMSATFAFSIDTSVRWCVVLQVLVLADGEPDAADRERVSAILWSVTRMHIHTHTHTHTHTYKYTHRYALAYTHSHTKRESERQAEPLTSSHSVVDPRSFLCLVSAQHSQSTLSDWGFIHEGMGTE